MNVADVRAELAGALEGVVASVAQYRTVPVDGFPAAVIEVDTITPSVFGDRTYDVDCTIRIMVSVADDPDAWAKMDDLLSSSAIPDALRNADLEVDVGAFSNIGADIEYDDGVARGFTLSVRVTC